MDRRQALTTIAALTAGSVLTTTEAEVVSNGQPWTPGEANLAGLEQTGDSLEYLTQAEFRTVGAIADRFIPADETSIGGKEAGCASFIDRQLAGDFGRAATQYRLGRFIKGTPEQGPQSSQTPAERYRQGLAALDAHCRGALGAPFADLPGGKQDEVLSQMEAGTLALGPDVEVKPLFELLLQNVREGFLSDPIYGGNRGMASWKMLGFPGAQYDFRDVLDQKGRKLDIIPISLVDNAS
ncbi:gluconate 2-dehydrogenase subunit 3 family protein [Burkholderia sp. Ac-20379]|uniref:gluconate 2-dehydrogenase subunit 3 family protein n=1 Tax=Burkholderia sp. Ac-20379 TaxID=2703900 RepID=UPI00198167C6|nr:gluconate 2-dehydrogenase subunit 3 family protein [Burkholderia sp. Ac-20379]MBN3722674.1 gluconate 2-dehydrogenase subunit 3 family protein [Burkholderia sp. Ac-20379]